MYKRQEYNTIILEVYFTFFGNFIAFGYCGINQYQIFMRKNGSAVYIKHNPTGVTCIDRSQDAFRLKIGKMQKSSLNMINNY